MNNCKKGDVAMIVRDTLGFGLDTCLSKLIGTPLTVADQVGIYFGQAIWSFEGQPLRCPLCAMPFDKMLDADLQPLRPRGKDTETDAPIEKPEAVSA